VTFEAPSYSHATVAPRVVREAAQLTAPPRATLREL